MSNYVLNNRGNFHLKLLRRFRNIAAFVVGSFILPHSVDGVVLSANSRNSLHRNSCFIILFGIVNGRRDAWSILISARQQALRLFVRRSIRDIGVSFIAARVNANAN